MPSPLRTAAFQGASAAFVAMFCYVTASLVPELREPYWAPIAAIVVLYPDREATRKASADRFFGTALGSLVGWGSATYWDHRVLRYGAAVLLAVALCHLLRRDGAARLCAVAVTVITLVPRSEPAGVVALHRFLEVSYGVLTAVAYTFAADAVARRLAR